jgi:ADP-heptose:LPS heptosyltransferase
VYRRRRFGWLRLPRLVRELRRARYDVALDLQGNLKSGVLTRLSGAGRRTGLAPPLSREGNRWFVRELVPAPPGHRLDAYLALLDRAVGRGPAAPALLPARPRDHGSVVLHPGTSRFGAFKRWPAERFAELGDLLAERLSAPVVLTAGPGERADADAVRRRMRGGAAVAETPSLEALVDLLAGARLVVACDTGPAHLAAAAGVPTVVLFGPKDPAVMAPRGPRVATVRAGVRCSPCALRFCPDPVCMTGLGVGPVAKAALELLGEVP